MTAEGKTSRTVRIGIDTGGTFTDFVVYDPGTGHLETFKLPSTPGNPADAVIAGIERVRARFRPNRLDVVHGSTVATNALLERKGARTALVTTAGFEDVLEIGRQDRPEIYALKPELQPPLVPVDLRFGLKERVNAAGEVLIAPDESAEAEILSGLQAAGPVDSVAVCLLFSFLHPDHEREIADRLAAAGYFVSSSHEILPEFREYERTSTTVINAYVAPILDRYLADVEAAVPNDALAIMQSNGGTISPGQARKEAVRCILSGPAGGVIAADRLAATDSMGAGRRMITIDMGGTSTDVSLIDGDPVVSTEAAIEGQPIGIPVLDIHTIGAGGGSIASIDPGGGLRVGPQSAGADPGPACYGRGDGPRLPTVTDANLLLGRLLPDRFLGGEMVLQTALARAAAEPLADKLGLSLEAAVEGIIAIVNAHMARALRVISVERGHDPAAFRLVSFGGAGGLHAVALARELGIPSVLVPENASTFSALGMLQADVVKDYSRTIMASGSIDHADLAVNFSPLLQRAAADMDAEGVAAKDAVQLPSLDLRFSGQSYEINVPYTERWREDFGERYTALYGYLPGMDGIEIVTIRLQARGAVPRPNFKTSPTAGADPASAMIRSSPVWREGSFADLPIYDAALLEHGNRIPGPALISRTDTTIWLPKGSVAVVDGYRNLMITVG